MSKNLSAVGLSSYINNSKKKSEVLKRISQFPDTSVSYVKNGNNFVEQYGYLTEDFGIVLYGRVQKDQQIKMRKWNTFAFSSHTLELSNVGFEKIRGDLFAFCEDDKTGNEIEFRVNNVYEYENYTKKHGRREIRQMTANIAGLATVGSVIFPMRKDQEAIRIRQEEEENHKELIRKLRNGDEAAEKQLLENSFQIAAAVRERLKKEDILSVFESYFMPHGDIEGQFAVLGDIEQAEVIKNKLTGEAVVKLLVNATNTKLQLFINQDGLMGMPIKGMRFMGICELQGNIIFN